MPLHRGQAILRIAGVAFAVVYTTSPAVSDYKFSTTVKLWKTVTNAVLGSLNGKGPETVPAFIGLAYRITGGNKLFDSTYLRRAGS